VNDDRGFRARTTFAVGVDPGRSTGLSIVRGDGFRVHVQQGTPSQVLDDFALRFPFLCTTLNTVLVGCERYTGGSGGGPVHMTSQPLPLQVIGVVAQLARLHQWMFRLQAPADAKALVNDQVLRDVGLWTLPSEVDARDANDANDATRHALAVLAFHRASMFDRVLGDTGV
jgi:hypothetical protein